MSHSIPKTTRDQTVIPKGQKLETFKIFVFELFIVLNSIAKIKAAFQNAHNISQRNRSKEKIKERKPDQSFCINFLGYLLKTARTWF